MALSSLLESQHLVSYAENAWNKSGCQSVITYPVLICDLYGWFPWRFHHFEQHKIGSWHHCQHWHLYWHNYHYQHYLKQKWQSVDKCFWYVTQVDNWNDVCIFNTTVLASMVVSASRSCNKCQGVIGIIAYISIRASLLALASFLCWYTASLPALTSLLASHETKVTVSPKLTYPVLVCDLFRQLECCLNHYIHHLKQRCCQSIPVYPILMYGLCSQLACCIYHKQHYSIVISAS